MTPEREHAAAVGAKLALLGLLAWGIVRVLRLEVERSLEVER